MEINSTAQKNSTLAIDLIHGLSRSGVTEYCVCPSSRNAPFVLLLNELKGKVRVYSFFEERAAAFFALGRIKQTQKPVAVVTTSGTAVGELLPAAMEGYYAGLPLVLLTADRPRRYRGTGAPQAAEQAGIFGIYTPQSLDLEGDERPEWGALFKSQFPLHLNACFDEPLIDAEIQYGEKYLQKQEDLGQLLSQQAFLFRSQNLEPQGAQAHSQVWRAGVEKFFQHSKNPIAIVSALGVEEREAVAELLLNWKIPAYFECLSGLREDLRMDSFRIHFAASVIENSIQLGCPIDGLIRIGGVPTLRLWRDLEKKFADLPVLSLTSLPFSGLARPTQMIYGDLRRVSEVILRESSFKLENRKSTDRLPDRLPDRLQDRLIELDRSRYLRLQELLRNECRSEPGILFALSLKIPQASRVYLGNSLPIREWDLAASWNNRGYEVWGSRGLNGIDGQISSFLGFAQEACENWAVFGDLTALYDLQGPWILSQMQDKVVNIVIINNGGGKIFTRIFPQDYFLNRHQVQFEGFAKLWGLEYEKWKQVPEDEVKSTVNRIIEIVPDEEATQRFWKEYDHLVKSV